MHDPAGVPKLGTLSMLLPVFQDLVKPQWRLVLEKLKFSGGLPVSELSREIGASYMTVKQHCDELTKLGYLDRSRIPRTTVGRPEIFFSLSAKADALFPEVGVAFTLQLLEDLKSLVGDTTPDKLLYQHFQRSYEDWEPIVAKGETIAEKAARLVTLREKSGCHVRLVTAADGALSLEEVHNPLMRVFDHYPRAVAMELRMIEQLLETRVVRREFSGGRSGQLRVVFELPAAAEREIE